MFTVQIFFIFIFYHLAKNNSGITYIQNPLTPHKANIYLAPLIVEYYQRVWLRGRGCISSKTH
jgi:hypothetical protein